MKLKEIKYYISNYQHLVRNFFSLSILNGLNFLLPLISLPYLVRVIGVERYGTISFANVIVQYVLLLSTYGFTFSATKLVAQRKGNKEELSNVFNAVVFVKFSIAIILLLFLFVCVLYIPKLNGEKVLYLYAVGIVLGDVFIPTWFFQGIEKMQYTTIVNSLSKITFTVLIFIFVKKVDDYPVVLLLNSFGYLFAGLISMIFIVYTFKIKFKLPAKSDMYFVLVDGWYIFITTISINLYRNTNTFILGILTNDVIVGYYSSAEKIIKAVQSIFSPVSEVLFPHFSNKSLIQGVQSIKENLYKIFKIYFLILLALTIALFFFAPLIVKILLGMHFDNSIIDVRIMSLVVLFGCLNYLLGVIGLINIGSQKTFALYVFISGISNVLITLILSPYLKDAGAAIGLLISEVALFVLCYRKLFQTKTFETVDFLNSIKSKSE